VQYIPIETKMTIFKKLMITVSLWLVAEQAGALIGYIAGWKSGVEMAVISGIMAVFVTMLLAGKGKKWVDRSDVMCGLLTVMSIVSFLVPLFRYTKSWRLPIISHGVDMAAHFNMFVKMAEYGKINFGEKYFDNFPPWSGWTEYPPGFYEGAAINFRMLAQIAGGKTDDLVMATDFFSVYTILIYGLMIYWLVNFAMVMIENRFGRMSGWHKAMMFFLLWGIIEGIFYRIYDFGFMAQICAMTWLIMMVWLTEKIDKKGFCYWLVLLFVNFAVANSWYFLTPLSLAILIFDGLREKVYNKWWIYPLVIVSGAMSFYPVWVSMKSFNVIDEIKVEGGVVAVKGYVLMTLMAMMVVFRRKIPGIITFVLSSSVIYLIIIGAFQIISRGKVSYFYSKTTYVIVGLALPVLVAVLGECFVKAKKQCNRWIFKTGVAVMIFIGILTGAGEENSIWGKREYFLTPEVYNAMITLRESGEAEKYYVIPFGDFKKVLWFYSYIGYLPKFYLDMWPIVEFDEYPWIFEKVKEVTSEKPLMIFDAYTYNQYFGDYQKEYVNKRGIKIYPEGAVID